MDSWIKMGMGMPRQAGREQHVRMECVPVIHQMEGPENMVANLRMCVYVG